MSIEERLNNRYMHIMLQWKAMKPIKYVPFVTNYILLPITLYLLSKQVGNDRVDLYFSQLTYLFVPIMSVWWILLILHEHIEGNGAEVLWIYEKGKLFDVLVFWGIYIISLIPGILYSFTLWLFDFSFYLQIISQSFFYAGAIYMLSFIFKSISTAFIPIFAYNMYADNRIFNILEKVNLKQIQSSGYYFFAGIICFGIGITYHQKIEKHDGN